MWLDKFKAKAAGIDRDLGPALSLECPGCAKTGIFHLGVIEPHVYTFLLVPFLKTNAFWCLVCPHCSHHIDLKGEDIARARTANDLAQRCTNGRISKPELLAETAKLDFAFLRELNAVRTEVICPHCGEKSPSTFAACWKCQGQLPVAAPEPLPFDGEDLRYDIQIPLAELDAGTSRTVSVQRPGVCPACHGEGHVSARTCQTCGGNGRFEESKNVTFQLKAGCARERPDFLRQGWFRLRISGEGCAGLRGGKAGDLYVVIEIVMPTGRK